MGESTQWEHRLHAVLTRTLTSLKFRILMHPMGQYVGSCLCQIQTWIYWELMYLAWNCVVYRIIWLGMIAVGMGSYYLNQIFILPIRELLVLPQGIKLRLSSMVSSMEQGMKRLVRLLVKVKRKEQD